MRTNRVFVLLFCIFVAACASPSKPDAPKPDDSKPASYGVTFTQYTLKNGLRVILSEDHSAPTYTIAMTYNVGSRDEKPGHTGFAHLFEHLMFEGSENVGKGEHFSLIEHNGGETNGNTTSDRTQYFETLPANQIDLGLFLESDRMRSLAVNQANFDNQRATVKEERRSRYDNQPYGRTYEVMEDTVYDNFAYKHSTIGSMADLDKAKLQDAIDFFKLYYAPNNCVLTMVGDFKSDDVLAKIKKYFEDIPQQAVPPAPDMTEPAQTAERKKTFGDALADLTEIDMAFKIPPGNTPDWYALDVAGTILSGGQSSRLYQELVKDKQVVTEVSSGSEERRGPAMWELSTTLRPGKDPADVEKLIYADIDKLKTEPATDAEMEKVRMLVQRSTVQQLETTESRATNLGELTVFYNDPALINSIYDKYAAVTKEQVQAAVQKYLVDTNRTVILTVPAAATQKKGQ